METRVWNKMESKTICYGGEWEDIQTTVRANVFAILMDLSNDRVKYYKSDLYHDAIWLSENITGCMQFDWVVRESGTFIGEVTRYVKDEEWSDAVRYRFEILVDDSRKWIVNIYEAGSSEETVSWMDRHAALDINECDVAKTIEGCIYHPAPVGGWHQEEDDPLDVSCIGYKTPTGIEHGAKDHDKINCPVHSYGSNENPTLGNESLKEKEINMQSVVEELREKLQDATSTRDEAYDARSNLDDFVQELDSYIDDVEELINNLNDLPEVSVEFEVDLRFDS